MQSRSIQWLSLALLLSVPALAQAAVSPPKEDVHFLLEHLAEAAQDARYFALPWPAATGTDWEPVVAVAANRFEVAIANTHGVLLAVGAARRFDDHWSGQLVGFFDQFDIGGNTTEHVLTPGPLGQVPLDVPERAEFSAPGGKIRHSGFAAIFRRDLQSGNSEWRTAGIAGLLLERLELVDFRIRYRLLAGANAGTTGILDYSGAHNFISPFVGYQAERTLGSRWTVAPRTALGIPLPVGKFDPRLTGPSFDLTPASTGSEHGRIGDGYLMVGVGMRDRLTGMEIDLGSILTFPLIERLTHEGVSRGIFISVTWRGRK